MESVLVVLDFRDVASWQFQVDVSFSDGPWTMGNIRALGWCKH